MKKIKILVAVAFLLLSLNASAQLNFGIKGSVSGNWIPKTMIVGTETAIVPMLGFNAGLFARTNTYGTVDVQAELLYALKGHKDITHQGNLNDKYTLALSYVQMPVLVCFNLMDGDAHLMLGPEFNLNVGAKAIDNNNLTGKSTLNAKDFVRPFNVALAVQTSYMVTGNLGVDLKFDFGLSKTFKEISSGIQDRSLQDKGHNTSIAIGVSYIFD